MQGISRFHLETSYPARFPRTTAYLQSGPTHSQILRSPVEAPGLQYTQKWAKNRQTVLPAGQIPQIPLIHLPEDPMDPVQALLDLHNLTPTAGPMDPMLLIPTPDGHFYVMDQRRLRAEFRQALIACDLDLRQYTPHSL